MPGGIYARRAGAWVNRNSGSGQGAHAPFTLRATEPMRSNSGHLADPDYDPTEPLVPYSGPGAGNEVVVTGNGEEFHNIDFGNTLLTLKGTDSVVKRCKGRNTLPRQNTLGSARGFINVNDDTQRRAHISFTTLENTARTITMAHAIQGHHFTTYRNLYEGFVDNIGIWWVQAPSKWDPLDILIQGDYMGPMLYLRAASGGIVHPSDTDTHNDSVQIQNGSAISIIGSALHAKIASAIGDGATPLANNSLAAVMGSFAVGEFYNIKVEDNWVFGGRMPFNFGSAPINSARYNLGTILRNRFDGSHIEGIAVIGIDPLWTGDFGVGDTAKMNAFMNPVTHERDLARPVNVSRNA